MRQNTRLLKGLQDGQEDTKATASHLRLSADRTRPRLCPAVSRPLPQRKTEGQGAPEPSRLQAQGPQRRTSPVSRLPSLMLLVDAARTAEGQG